ARPHGDRRLATRIQRRAPKTLAWRTDAVAVRPAVDPEDGYSNAKTLNPTATQSGGTSLRQRDRLVRRKHGLEGKREDDRGRVVGDAAGRRPGELGRP